MQIVVRKKGHLGRRCTAGRKWWRENENECISVWNHGIGGGFGSDGRDGLRNEELCAESDGAAGGTHRPTGIQDGDEQPGHTRRGRPGAGGYRPGAGRGGRGHPERTGRGEGGWGCGNGGRQGGRSEERR